MRSGRRPSSEGTRLLFAGTISPTTRPVNGPTEGRQKRTRRKARQEEGRDTEPKKQNQQSYLMSYIYTQGRHKRPKGGLQTITNQNKRYSLIADRPKQPRRVVSNLPVRPLGGRAGGKHPRPPHRRRRPRSALRPVLHPVPPREVSVQEAAHHRGQQPIQL